MLEEGADVFRINFSHADYADVAERIKMIRELNEEFGYTCCYFRRPYKVQRLRVGVMEDDVFL